MKISNQLMLTHSDAVRVAQHVDRKDENLKGDFIRLFRLIKTAVGLALAIEKDTGLEPGVQKLTGPQAFEAGRHL